MHVISKKRIPCEIRLRNVNMQIVLTICIVSMHFGQSNCAYDLGNFVSLVISRKYRGWWKVIHQRQSVKAEEP